MRRGAAGPSRREAARLIVAGVLAVVLRGHTPYSQWTIYRKRNLFIVASRSDEQAVLLAKAVAEGIAAELPDSHARFTRATEPVRVASLLRTGQLEVAVVAREEAAAMLTGADSYASVGPVPLRLLAGLGDHLVVTVADFRDRHAFLLAQALDPLEERLARPQGAVQTSPVPFHTGALAYRNGRPIPAGTAEDDSDAHPHRH